METINVGKKEEMPAKEKEKVEQTKLDIRVPIFRKMELTIKSFSEGEFKVKKDKNTWNVCFKRMIVVGRLFDESLANNFAEKYNKITKDIKETIQTSMDKAEASVAGVYKKICSDISYGTSEESLYYKNLNQKKVAFGKINSVVMDLAVPPCITPKEASILSSGPIGKKCKYTECAEYNGTVATRCSVWDDIGMCTGVVEKKPEVKQCQYSECSKHNLRSVSKCGEFGDISKCTSEIKKNLISIPLFECEIKECSDYNERIKCKCNTFEDISRCSRNGGDDLPF